MSICDASGGYKDIPFLAWDIIVEFSPLYPNKYCC